MRASTETAEAVNGSALPLLPPGPLQLVRPQPVTHVIAGSVPDPLLSSRARGWNGLTLELHSFHELDTVVQPADHVIAVHLAGNVTLRQRRAGHVRSRAMNPGDVTITPVGPATHWQQAGHSIVVLLRLSPAYVRTVAGDECAMDPDRFAIQGVFSVRDRLIDGVARRLLAGLELEGADSHLYVDTLDVRAHPSSAATLHDDDGCRAVVQGQAAAAQAASRHRVHRREPAQSAFAIRACRRRRLEPGTFRARLSRGHRRRAAPLRARATCRAREGVPAAIRSADHGNRGPRRMLQSQSLFGAVPSGHRSHSASVPSARLISGHAYPVELHPRVHRRRERIAHYRVRA